MTCLNAKISCDYIRVDLEVPDDVTIDDVDAFVLHHAQQTLQRNGLRCVDPRVELVRMRNNDDKCWRYWSFDPGAL